MPIRIKINSGALNSYLYGSGGAVSTYMRQLAEEVRQDAQRFAPQGEGVLRGSFEIDVQARGKTTVATITSRLPYAVYVHEGTGLFGPRADYIYPKSGRFLVFRPTGGAELPQWGQGAEQPVSSRRGRANPGGLVFARRTRGMPGVPYYYLALKSALPSGRWRIRRIPYAG